MGKNQQPHSTIIGRVFATLLT